MNEEDDSNLDAILCPLCCNSGTAPTPGSIPDTEMKEGTNTGPIYQPSSKVQALLENLQKERLDVSNMSEDPIKRKVPTISHILTWQL